MTESVISRQAPSADIIYPLSLYIGIRILNKKLLNIKVSYVKGNDIR